MEPKCDLSLQPHLIHRLVWEDRAEELDQVISQHLDDTVADPKYGHIPLVDVRFRGSTALGLAAQLGRQRCVEVLLKHWADTLLASDIGYYPLQEATSLGDREIMKLLLLRRHEQMRQIWKVRQPGLCEALHSELPDFFLEMDWHFRSWVPFLSRLCPSDRCRIWKRGNRLRVDSSLMGVDVEKLNWIRGNISYIFHVHEDDSKMFVVDHDRRLYEEIDKMRDFTPEEVEEDLSSRLNSQIYSGKVRKPHAEDGSKRLIFVRQQSGLFGLGGDREEQVGPYQTKVYDIPNVEVIARYRKEHLQAREAMSAPLDDLAAETADAEGGSLKSDQVLQELESAEPQVQGIINDARKNLYTFAPSLPRPSHLPSVTATEYFATPAPYMHVGRQLVQSERSKHFTVSVWMAENFPLTVRQLLPFLEMMALGNKNFEKVQDIISMDLPPGFPIRIEIPLFAFLAAQITFLNFGFWRGRGDEGTPPPAPQFTPTRDDPTAWFDIPSDYAEGIVIKNILKDS